jgi:hypothetical protein
VDIKLSLLYLCGCNNKKEGNKCSLVNKYRNHLPPIPKRRPTYEYKGIEGNGKDVGWV